MQTDVTHADPSRRWRLIALVAVAVAVIAIAVAAYALGRGSQPNQPGTFTASGTMLIFCAGPIVTGYPVEITDMSGKKLAASTLGAGHPTGKENRCAYPFVFQHVPAGGARYYVLIRTSMGAEFSKPASVSETDLRDGRAEIKPIY